VASAFPWVITQVDHLVAKFNKMEEEEFQGQLMAKGHYMIDEEAGSNSCHEHVQATTTFGSEKIVDNNEKEEKKGVS
jgi:hypothetical protein